MRHVYKVGYHSWEESPHVYLTHTLDLSQEEFTQLVATAVESLLREGLSVPFSGEGSHYLHYEDLFPDKISEWLIRERSFSPLPVQASVSVYGWQRLIDEPRSGLKHSPEQDLIFARIVESGLVPVLEEHSNQVDFFLTSLSAEDVDDKGP